MTRINCIPPEELTTLHLLAEYRELPRVFTLAQAASVKNSNRELKELPENYCLGKGHVTFFYNKLRYCWLRWLCIAAELTKRGIRCDPNIRTSILKAIAPLSITTLWNNWEPKPCDQYINRERIRERLDEYHAKNGK